MRPDKLKVIHIPPRHLKKSHCINWKPYLYIFPVIMIIMIFLFYPILKVFYYSLMNYDLNKPWDFKFIGIINYRDILRDTLFYHSMLNSIKWVFNQVVLQLGFGLVVALLLNRSFKGCSILRSIAFSPWAISGVLTSMMWSLMFQEHIGIINDLLLKLGLIKNYIAWTGNPKTVFSAIVVAELWRGIPFFAITLLAALQTIPMELKESCKVDGGTPCVEFMYITLPYLKDTIVLTTLLRTVWEFKNVDMIYTLTAGGPAYLTTTYSVYIAKQAIEYNNFGYGSALTVVSFTILFIFSALYLHTTKFGEGGAL